MKHKMSKFERDAHKSFVDSAKRNIKYGKSLVKQGRMIIIKENKRLRMLKS